MNEPQGAPAGTPDSPYPHLHSALLNISELLRSAVAQASAPDGLTAQQYAVLRIVAPAGDTGLPTLEIARQMVEKTPGITRLVDRLVEQGLLQRRRGQDRRQMLCSATRTGRELLERVDQRVMGIQSRVFECLTRNESGALLHLLARLRVRIEKETM